MGMLKDIKDQLNRSHIASWKTLEDVNELQNAHKQSFEGPVVLFKHSTSCGTSARAKYLLEQGWEDLAHTGHFYFLDLLRFRPVSNAIAQKYGVVHQSPQIIVLLNGESVYDTSHHRISVADLGHQLSLLK